MSNPYQQQQQQQDNNQGFYYDQFNYDMGAAEQFPAAPQFGQFDYTQSSASNPQQYPEASYYSPAPNAYAASNAYTGSIMTPDANTQYAGETSDFENEPPLMEELGINFEHICHKTLAVLNPLKQANAEIMQDTDLAGPLVFCFAFGGSLLLSGKVHFGYIYGIGVVGCLAMYALLNLMSLVSVSVSCIVSVLGYCLLPMVLLSFFSVVMSLQGMLGTALTVVCVVWCSISASKLFVSALTMDRQQLLVAYPCALVYGVFALLTVF